MFYEMLTWREPNAQPHVVSEDREQSLCTGEDVG